MSQQRIRQIIEDKARMEGGLRIGGGAMRSGMRFGGCQECPSCDGSGMMVGGGKRVGGAQKPCGPGRMRSSVSKKGKPYTRKACIEWSNPNNPNDPAVGYPKKGYKCSGRAPENYTRCVSKPKKQSALQAWRLNWLANEYQRYAKPNGVSYADTLKFYSLGDPAKGKPPGPGAQTYITERQKAFPNMQFY